ncbi:histidinol-phosphatase [Pokkaliibacter plantistimulans]|uniref:Histidinol-phosphatase n=1 Tax=Proteobacteria bacterium 228 TaxID=2083153 RepID=A0A2S5KNN6_9PROT|nr:histidinol-phosphatase [Pokkaliibacter plantistimulans]PPC76454.1 histidinol-phosphatase [Pokkaliibacter plantistimulans]
MMLTLQDIQTYRAFAELLAEAAATAIAPYFRTQMDVEDKGSALFDPVTLGDKAAERAMRDLLAQHYPEHGILGEEEDRHVGSSPLTWVLDPIDGTRAFITGLPLWGTLIALNDGQYPRIGVMNQPYTRERFVGTPEGAWLNGEPLKVRPCASLAQAKITCTTPQMFDAPQLALFNSVAEKARLVRFGGDCYAYCMLAAGHIDAVVEADLKPYDVQALMPIVEGAGGVMTTWNGGDAQNGGAIVACGDKRLHAEILALLQK